MIEEEEALMKIEKKKGKKVEEHEKHPNAKTSKERDVWLATYLFVLFSLLLMVSEF